MAAASTVNNRFRLDDPHDTLRRWKETIEILRESGIPASPGSRLQRFAKVIQERTVVGRPAPNLGGAAGRELLQARIELADAADAIRTVSVAAPQGWQGVAREVVSGAGVAWSAKATTEHERDVLFRLLTGAALIDAGYPLRFADNYIEIDLESGPLAVAARRPGAEAKVRSAVRDAAKELERADAPGLVAIDLTLAVNPSDVTWRQADPILAQAILRHGTELYVTKTRDGLVQEIRPQTVGILLRQFRFVEIPNYPRPLAMSAWHCEAVQEMDEAREAELEKVAGRIMEKGRY